ncbi:MGMT family protein [Roseiflexus sp.]
MASRRKTWQEKMADKEGLPKILPLEERFPCYNALHSIGVEAGDPVVLVNSGEVVALMRQMPYGHLITIIEICQALARHYQVRGCCTLTTGIVIMTAANAAVEAGGAPPELDIPYWRTLKADGFLNEKFPGGAEAHRALLEQEGFTIARKGRRYVVADYRRYLFTDFSFS